MDKLCNGNNPLLKCNLTCFYGSDSVQIDQLDSSDEFKDGYDGGDIWQRNKIKQRFYQKRYFMWWFASVTSKQKTRKEKKDEQD